ncbi:hypothetical protein DL98DRAFT_620203 [Cadophora sp. DSE1049]|nr:hypothetical protein DL98DRAFT_620203 [Cadophora sp. DSE1049]
MAFNNGKGILLTILTMSATITLLLFPSDLSKLPDFFDILTNLRRFHQSPKLFHQKHSPPPNFTHHTLHISSHHIHPPQISPSLAKMVTQTRGMARSASRSEFIQYQSNRHQTRSVVRATTLFKSLPEGTPPPSIPQPRTRKRRAPAPEPEDEAGRPAKLRRRAAPPAPAPASAPAAARSPSPPPANLSPPASPSTPSPTPPPPYISAPVPSPTTIFPARQGHSFKPLATPAEAARASFFLDLHRNDFHGTPEGAAFLHHYPGAPVPPEKTARSWALERPQMRAAKEEAEDKKEKIIRTRFGEFSRGVSRSPRKWLKIRMSKTEDPSQEIQRARRLQTAIDKKIYTDKGHCLLTADEWRYIPWTPSDLPDELGWRKIEGSIYWDDKTGKAKRWHLLEQDEEDSDDSDDSEDSEESEEEDA